MIKAKKVKTAPPASESQKKQLARSRKRKVMLVGVTMVLILGASGFVFVKFNELDESPDLSEDYSQNLLQADESIESKIRIVQDYGTDYDAAMAEVRNSDITEWDENMLDKAYLSLVYADKIGAFTQVYTLLSMLQAAQANGQDIDNNRWGIDQQARDAMLERANDRAGQGRNATEGNDE